MPNTHILIVLRAPQVPNSSTVQFKDLVVLPRHILIMLPALQVPNSSNINPLVVLPAVRSQLFLLLLLRLLELPQHPDTAARGLPPELCS